MRRKKVGKRNYEVGFGKPPSSNQFKKGVSGNPSGRPAKAKHLPSPADVLDRVGRETLKIQIGTKLKHLAKSEIVFRQVMNKTIKGDLQAARQFLQLVTQYCPEGAFQESHTITVYEGELEI